MALAVDYSLSQSLMTMNADDVLDRANVLRNQSQMADRARIRSVMNGGAEGVQAVLNYDGNNFGQKTSSRANLGVDLPTANVMFSGLERLAQKIGRPPTLKTDMVPTRDTQTARKSAEKRARIVQGWDDMDRMELQYPQIGRWLPGYGFTFHIIKDRTVGGYTYPVAELRNPYDVHPGAWGPNQQPTEAAVFRSVSRKEFRKTYPWMGEALDRRYRKEANSVPILGATGSWEGNPHHPVTLIEYLCADGTYVVCAELAAICDFIPNPLESGPAFVVTKRFSFDQLQSQFHHTFGLMAMMGKLNILGLIGTEDATFRETNIVGEMKNSNTYKRGRFAVNEFEPGTRIEKPTSDQLQQTWQAINILERQFRVVSGYPVAQDGQSPHSFATGQGIRELGESANDNVREYQTAIRHGMELNDRKRLEWDEKMYPRSKKRVYWYEGGSQFEETYIPSKDIAGDYRTNRVYGAMATFDENSKIVAGLQLLQARIIDRRTLQENLDNFGNVSLTNERIDQDMAKEQMLQGLGQRFAERDPAAAKALAQILERPSETAKVLIELFVPEDEGPSQADMMMQQQAGMEAEMGPPPAVQTILSQMESAGGGVQSVGRMA